MSRLRFHDVALLGFLIAISVWCVEVECQALVNQYLIALYGSNEVATGDPRGVGNVNLTLDFSSQNLVYGCQVISSSAPLGASLYFGALDSAGALVS